MKKWLLGLMILCSASCFAQTYVQCTLTAAGYCPTISGTKVLNAGIDTHNVYIVPIGTPGSITVVIQGSVIGDFTDAATCGTSTTTSANLLSCSGIYSAVRVHVSTLTTFTSVNLTYVGTSSVAKNGGASGTVTRVSGTPNQIDVATGTTTPVISLDSAITFPGSATVSNGNTLTIASGATLTCAAGSTCPGGGSPASGTSVVTGVTCGATASAGINGYSLWQFMPGNSLTYLPATWKVAYAYYGGTGVSMNKSVVMKTARGSLAVLSTTNITFSSSATYVSAFSGAALNAPFFVTSDAISLQLDNTHDYYIMTYFDSDGTNYNSALVTCQQNSSTIDPVMWAQYEAGDQTGVTTIPAFVSGNKQTFIVGVQVP